MVLSSVGLSCSPGIAGGPRHFARNCRSAFFCAAQLALQPAWTVRAMSGRYHAQSNIFLSDQRGRRTAEFFSVGHHYKQPDNPPGQQCPRAAAASTAIVHTCNVPPGHQQVPPGAEVFLSWVFHSTCRAQGSYSAVALSCSLTSDSGGC